MTRSTDSPFETTFNPADWALTFLIAGIWGSSFLWIAIGLDSFGPWSVAFGRVALGGAALWAVPATRQPVPSSAWPAIAVVAVAGNAGPAVLFALAQQSVDSSVAGMLNSVTPIAVLVVGIAFSRRVPGLPQLGGIAIGFVGAVSIAGPSITGANARPAGIGLLMLAVVGYGVANNMIVAPQRKHGSLPIVGRALLVATALLAPVGLPSLARSTPTLASLAALLVLGVLGTGIARTLNATLIGRAGAIRASIVTYLAPAIAIALGAVVRNETIEVIEIIGTAAVLAGAWLATRPGPHDFPPQRP